MELLRDFFLPEMVFLRYALLIGALSSIALGVIGTMVVTRRISSIAGASAHAALGGVGDFHQPGLDGSACGGGALRRSARWWGRWLPLCWWGR